MSRRRAGSAAANQGYPAKRHDARRAVGTALVGALALVAGACSASSGSTTPTKPTNPSASVTRTSSTATTTTTAPKRSPVGFPTPREAAQHLVDAWRNRDSAAALQGADPAAVLQMFTAPPPNGSIYECDKGDSSPSYCGVQVYGAKLLYVRLEMVQRPVGWVVDYADVEPLH